MTNLSTASADTVSAEPNGPVTVGFSRTDRLLQGVDRPSSHVIEIGPGYSPAAPKAAGWNTHVVDHTTAEGLRQKYADAGIDLNAIEDVDTVWDAGPLHEAVPADLLGSFNILIASHLIEHVTDFVRFLVSAQCLLRPDGIVSLAVPDKRYCFDYFKSPTMTGDVLEAYAAKRSRHTIRTAWNSFAYGVLLDGALGVADPRAKHTQFMNSFTDATLVLNEFLGSEDRPYQDHHAWYFTPAGFSLVILELGHLRLIDWRVRSVHGPVGFEFFVTLCRGVEHLEHETLQQRRMDLLRRLIQEVSLQAAPEMEDVSQLPADRVPRWTRMLRRMAGLPHDGASHR